MHNTRERFTVNQKNNGAISNFDPDAVVEVPAYIGSMGAETISIGKIPTFHKGLMELQKLTKNGQLTQRYLAHIKLP
ncbi:hypothetical protein SDC49_07365 [Lactobacillus sp. R2/2]|nr:hypothetical protein [Lactobacillus sp. R2/2]